MLAASPGPGTQSIAPHFQDEDSEPEGMLCAQWAQLVSHTAVPRTPVSWVLMGPTSAHYTSFAWEVQVKKLGTGSQTERGAARGPAAQQVPPGDPFISSRLALPCTADAGVG